MLDPLFTFYLPQPVCERYAEEARLAWLVEAQHNAPPSPSPPPSL